MSRDFISVTVAGEVQLIDMGQVREILPMVELQETQRAERNCRGFLNLRGEIIPIFDLRPERPQLSAQDFIVVFEGFEDGMGIVVDDVRDVVQVSDEALKTRHFSDGDRLVAQLEGQLVPILDPEADTRGIR